MKANDAADVTEISLESVIESRLADEIAEELADYPDNLEIRCRHEMQDGSTPAITVSAVRQGDADVPGYWFVDVEVVFEFANGELEQDEVERVWRAVDECMGEGTTTLKARLADNMLAVAGVEYDDAVEIERTDGTETRTYAAQLIAGLYSPLA